MHPVTIGFPLTRRLSRLIAAVEKSGYSVKMRLIPNTCPHGPPCCAECKRLPENVHQITVDEIPDIHKVD